jgi:hypothetical protein
MVTCQTRFRDLYEDGQQNNLDEPDRKRVRIEQNHTTNIDEYTSIMAECDKPLSLSKGMLVSDSSSNSVIISNVPPTVTIQTLQDFVEKSLTKFHVKVVGCYGHEQQQQRYQGGQHVVMIKMDLETKYQARMAFTLNFVYWKNHTIYVKLWYYPQQH